MAPIIGPGEGVDRSRRAVLSAVQCAPVQQPADHEECPGVRRSADMEDGSFPAAGSAHRSDQRPRNAEKNALRSGGGNQVLALLAALGSGLFNQRRKAGE